MLKYILTAVAYAVIPLILAGYSNHLATLALPRGPNRRRAKTIVWGLVGLGIVVSGALQVTAYSSDIKRDVDEQQFRASVLGNLQSIIAESDLKEKKAKATTLESTIKSHGNKNVIIGQNNGSVTTQNDNKR